MKFPEQIMRGSGFVSEPEFFQGDAEDIPLYDYQQESVQRVRDNFRKPNVHAQILSIPTGGGKTHVGAHLLKQCFEKGKRGMFIVDRISLLGQTSRTLDRYGVTHGVIAAGHPRYRPGELIQVASIHTLARRGWPSPVDLIISDEQHVLYRAMMNKIARKDAKILGLTATPFTRGLGKHFQEIVNVTTTNKLIAQGVLCPFKVWAAAEPDMTGAKVVAGEWTDEEASKRATKIVGDVVKEYLEKGDGGKAVAFGVDVPHCEEMQRQFLAAGVNACLYTYLTPDEEREMLIGELGEFRKPDSVVRVLISVAALSRGFDVPDISVVLMCRPLRKSFMEFLQVIGRGLRASPGKSHCRILDLAGNFMRHYPAMMEFFEEGALSLDDGKPKPKATSVPKEKKPKKCPKCSFVFGAGSHCPSCGYIFVSRSTVEHEAGSLSEFDGAHAVKMDREAKMKLFSELRYICHRKGYKDGWASHAYRNITGVWPGFKRTDDTLPPSAATLRAVQAIADQRSKTMRQKTPVPAGMELDLFA